MKIVAIIQARMGSTRLPGKVLLKLQGKSVLEHVIERVKQATLIDEIIVATTTLPEDDVLAAKAMRYGVRVHRGSSDNVLSRYYEAAKKAEAQVVVRITSDCPLIDPFVINHVIEMYYHTANQLVTNVGTNPNERTFPRGLDVEVFSFEALEKAHNQATKDYEREHVTPLIYDLHQNHISCYVNEVNYAKYRWTLDTTADLELISEIYTCLYHGRHDFYLHDIIKLFKEQPQLFEINGHIEQKVTRLEGIKR